MIHKWYRGHDGNQKATDNFGIIWITDEPEYAQLYADEYGNEGVVSVLYIDENKLNYAVTYYDDDFDVWFPDMAKVKEYQKEGYNCYSFPVSIDGLDCDCIALFDESAIVKIEKMNKNESKNMNRKNTIRLTESELKNIIAESVKNILREDNSFHDMPNTEVKVDDEGEKILLWHGREMDYWEVENYLYREYEYEMEELNQTESEEGFEMWLNAKGEKYITNVLSSLFWPQGAGFVTESTVSKIRLTESELKKVIAESVKKILSEIGDTPRGQYAMAAVAGRAHQRGQMARANGNQEEYYKQIDKASDVDKAREDASVKSQNNGQMWGGDAARATSRGYTYGINKEKKRQGMTN